LRSHGKRDPGCLGRTYINQANNVPAVQRQQWAATVARVYGGIGLDQLTTADSGDRNRTIRAAHRALTQ
jgi:hypothetical protein